MFPFKLYSPVCSLYIVKTKCKCFKYYCTQHWEIYIPCHYYLFECQNKNNNINIYHQVITYIIISLFYTVEQWVCANSARDISPVLFTLPNLLLHYFYWPVNSKANCEYCIQQESYLDVVSTGTGPTPPPPPASEVDMDPGRGGGYDEARHMADRI